MEIIVLDSAYKHHITNESIDCDMNIDKINADEEVKRVSEAVAKGEYRQATKKESMIVRLAALSKIVHAMQEKVENDKELVEA
jgi:hypothetical protein